MKNNILFLFIFASCVSNAGVTAQAGTSARKPKTKLGKLASFGETLCEGYEGVSNLSLNRIVCLEDSETFVRWNGQWVNENCLNDGQYEMDRGHDSLDCANDFYHIFILGQKDGAK